MERHLTTASLRSCFSMKSTGIYRMLAAMLVTSLLAGSYTMLRHVRRRTVLRPASRDYSHDRDVTVETPTMIGGNWRSRGPDVDNDFVTTTLDGDSLQLCFVICLPLCH